MYLKWYMFGSLPREVARVVDRDEADITSPPASRSLWRNPWFWVLVAVGVGVIVYLGRPLLRPIPPPPPVSGRLPPLALHDHRGEPLADDALSGKVWVATVVAWPCDEVCDARLAALAGLSRRIARRDLDVRLLLLTGGTGSAVGVHRRAEQNGLALSVTVVARAAGPELARFRQVVDLASNAPVLDGGARPGASGRPLVIVDRDGGIRGAYPDTEQGLDEVVQRAEHVILGTL